VLELLKDSFFGPHSTALTIYNERDGRLNTIFGSTQPVMQWDAGTGNAPRIMLIHYSNGMQGYRWIDGKFDPDASVKNENFRGVIAMVLMGMGRCNEAEGAGWIIVPFVFLVWFYRLIKFLILTLFRCNYRPFSFLRGVTLGCALPVLVFSGLFVMMLFGLESCGRLLLLLIIDQAGWVVILIAAAIPDWRVSIS
jgi:hypothetical protein